MEPIRESIVIPVVVNRLYKLKEYIEEVINDITFFSDHLDIMQKIGFDNLEIDNFVNSFQNNEGFKISDLKNDLNKRLNFISKQIADFEIKILQDEIKKRRDEIEKLEKELEKSDKNILIPIKQL